MPEKSRAAGIEPGGPTDPECSARVAPGASPDPTPSPTGLPGVDVEALAISVPERIVTNEHWRKTQGRLVREAEKRIWMWKRPLGWSDRRPSAFDLEMEPFLDDPFRGSVQRRLLAPGGTALELEADAARKALDAAGLPISEVDLLLVTSFLPDRHGIGGAAFLAQELGHAGAAWNLESACSSANLSLLTAAGLIRSGQFRRALLVSSCTYSRAVREQDPISWTIGDAAGAMILCRAEAGHGYLGGHTVHTGNTCGAVRYLLDIDDDGVPYPRMQTGRAAGKLLRESSEPNLRTCVSSALAQADLELADLDFAVFNTPLAWYAYFCARVLGMPRSKTINMHPIYNNVGPCLTLVNLFHAAHWHLGEGDRVLLYSVGSVSSCAATVLRWG
ncbi:MAG: hypothetical protein MI919_33620, partial [Holophagales bacterium]|nr:hypothetical protein [Holophagales bacterium]